MRIQSLVISIILHRPLLLLVRRRLTEDAGSIRFLVAPMVPNRLCRIRCQIIYPPPPRHIINPLNITTNSTPLPPPCLLCLTPLKTIRPIPNIISRHPQQLTQTPTLPHHPHYLLARSRPWTLSIPHSILTTRIRATKLSMDIHTRRTPPRPIITIAHTGLRPKHSLSPMLTRSRTSTNPRRRSHTPQMDIIPIIFPSRPHPAAAL